MRIAIPREIMSGERRVAATPDSVKKYLAMGHDVSVETGAGGGIFAPDDDYAAAGARIVSNVEELLGTADVVLKVKQPIFNEAIKKHEAEMIREGAMLIAFLHPAAPGNHDVVRILRDRNITSFTMDAIPRIPRAQRMDALTSMSTCTGYRAVLNAAMLLPKFLPMIGTAIGTIKPAEVLVVGTGVVGMQSVATAKRLGAVVRGWDIRAAARTEAGSLGAKIEGFDVPEELVIGQGGYAKALSPEWLEKEREALAPITAKSDIVVLSALIPGERAPILVTEEMVAGMKPGSVIVDVSIDQGGNCQVTETGREIEVHGVTVSGIQNVPGRMPVHSTWLYASNMACFVENLLKAGPALDLSDQIVKESLVTMNGKIHFQPALIAMGGA